MRFFTGLGVLLLLGVGGAGAMWWLWGRDLPSVQDLDVLELSGKTRVYDRNGALVGTLTPSLSSGQSVNRDLLKLNEISPWLQKAIVTSEDRRFYKHHGVDYIGIARGLLKGVLKNDLEGGSSITQQVVKNTLLADLHSARTPERKFKEALLAYQLERSFNKDQILNAYLNVIYWGDGGRSDIIGAGTAAQAYFRKSASDLNLAESVYLTTLVPAPNERYKDFKAYRPLMKDLLGRMVEDGRITQAEADAAWRTPIYPAGWRIGWNSDGTVRTAVLERPERLQENMPPPPVQTAFHYLQAVEKELIPKLGRKALFGGGKVYTALDLQAQQASEQASLNARLPDGATLGLALVSPKNGEVLALVGQKLTGGRPGDWNNAVQAQRQVGSSIKPLLYTLALSKGWKQSDTVLDAPLAGDYQPQNYDGRWTGRYVTMRYALDHSLNLPTVRIAQEVGVNAFEDKLRELGLTPPPDAGLSLSIGTLEASPLQMAAAYAAFANGGLYYAPTLVRKVEDDRGRTLYQRPAPQGKRVWDARAAWLGLDMIRGVVNDLTEYQGGLATRAQIPGWDVGGKTGTTNDVKDLWFAGVTPTVAGAVWVGKQAGGALPNWAYSGEIPTPVWQQAVAGALAGQPHQTFTEPGGITYRVVRQVEMAFRQEEADQEPVARDGSGDSSGGGFFGRRQRPPAPVPVPAPNSQPGPLTEAPTQEVPDQAAPDQPVPDPQGPLDTVPAEPVPSEPSSPQETSPQDPYGAPQEGSVPQDGAGDTFTPAPPEAPSGDLAPQASPTEPQPVPDPSQQGSGDLPLPPDGFWQNGGDPNSAGTSTPPTF
ncbi:peptidoglycan glycosyltransferase [Deinococcus metallilatus]|uniref:peptidoglycan glycosyltransferase n=1 Tax=Deinococcus metallilatus TaxID=1211322 RepID=A0AAJ5JYM6_9DEIO|nr:transglycosylase domain-containing protein [Deinococcus metallilatus]MBB5297253.1 membrane peptidoglycan carboxypeptidase [Deinococcus metallilatus]QBY09669.1 peptidoglycan glycosyltransferase [Deinococcus metallilatus]RXJ09041.1 peptidoglycan glycosyltransferase [Deinococcus metallilatus]TLK21296.1 peptidoglycan glycosyltransferase [Deinococcus metallilatus]